MEGLLRSAVIGCTLAATGCLSTPGPAAGDDDGPAMRCSQGARPAGQPWPPSGVDVEVRGALIADVDADGTGDLIVTTAPRAGSAATVSRIYVLYGPVSHTAPVWHAMLDLDDDALDAEIQPLGVSLDDLDRDGCLDLTVAGAPTGVNTQERVAVWRHDRSFVPWRGPPVKELLDFDIDARGPVTVVWGDLGSATDRELVVADLYNVQILAGSSLDDLGNAITVPPPLPCETWGYANALIMAPGGPSGRERLLLFGRDRINTIQIGDDSQVTVQGACDVIPGPGLRGFGVAALDDVAPLDLLIGEGGQIGARVISGSAAVTAPSSGEQACNFNPRGDYIDGVAAGNLDANTTPDVVLIDHDPGADQSWACLVTDLAVDGDDVTKQFADDLLITSGELRTVVIGDLGAGTRVWMLKNTGELFCRWVPMGTQALDDC